MDAQPVGLGHGLVDGLVDDLVIHGVFLGDGIGHQHTAAQTHVLLHIEGLGQLGGSVDAVVHLEAGLPGVEGRQLLGAVADDGNAVGLQIFQRQAQVQNGLGAGADHHDGGVGQLLQVGGDVEGLLSAPVDAADAAGGEHLNTGHVSDDHGGGNGGGTVPALGHQNGQVPAAGLGDAGAGLAQVIDLSLGQAGLQAAADDGDGGGYCAVFADDLLHVQGSLHVLGIGHTVRDDGGFQSHHGAALLQGLLHFGSNVQVFVQRHVRFLHIVRF